MLKQNSFITNFVVFSSLIQMNVFVNELFSNSLLRYYSFVKHILHGFPLFRKQSLLIIYCVKYAEIRAFLVHIFPYMDRIVSVFFVFGHQGLRFCLNSGKYDSLHTRERRIRESLYFRISCAVINCNIT